MHNQLRGCIQINVKGKNLYKFINALHGKRLFCSRQYVRNQVFYAEIYRHDLDIIKTLASEYNVELSHFEYETLSKKFLRYKKRFGIFFGCIASAFIIWYFSSTVMVIEIKGNSSVGEDIIRSALDELGVVRGAFINDIDFNYCGNELRVRVDGISWASLRRTGNRIVVDVTEMVDSPDMLRKRIPCNIIADKSAEITSFSILDGQLLKLCGDHVNPGDMLVSGVVRDDHNNITLHHAMGEIRGIYSESALFSVPFSSEKLLPTGNNSTQNHLHLFSLDIPLFIGSHHFSDFTSDSEEKPLVLFGKKFPISLISVHFNELRPETVTLSDEQAEAELMHQIYLYEMNFLSDKKIISRKIHAQKNDSAMTYTVKYTVEGEIGVQKDIYVK